MEEAEKTFDNEQYRKTYWHTCSHILAQALTRLYPGIKLAIGPSIDEGFYYDVEFPESFSQENLKDVEKEMRKICKEKNQLERFELSREEAKELMKDQPYKLELIDGIPEGDAISFYRQGEFTDLCAGPHLDATNQVNGVGLKLTSCTGAYWRGDEHNKMLTRIYGIGFPTKEELTEYVTAKEEAKKRDHRLHRARSADHSAERRARYSDAPAMGGRRRAEARLSPYEDAVHGETRSL